MRVDSLAHQPAGCEPLLVTATLSEDLVFAITRALWDPRNRKLLDALPIGPRIRREAALDNLAIGARIALCGAIAGYDDRSKVPGPANYTNLIIRRASMRGFLVLDFLDRALEAVGKLVQWSQEGKLVNAVDVAEGLEQTPKAFRNLFTGGNLGKQLVRIA